jgi:poly(A) polymerase
MSSGEAVGAETSAEERPLARVRWLQAPEVQAVLAAVEAGGKPARFVGGCVRDSLLDPSFEPTDIDLATPEPPERVIELLERAGIRAIPTGIEHGTVTAVTDRRQFEITTLRRDVETFGRHARVAFTDDFMADAARRDFTINAMSADRDGRLYDPFGGRADLRAGRVRFVGEPRQRIREDYLRILRFFRFFARFGRPPADPAALEACAAEAAGLRQLSAERIRQELLRLLEAQNVVTSLKLMQATGVLAYIFPWPVSIERLQRLLERAPEADAILRLAALVRAAERDASKVDAFARALRLSNRERDRLVRLATAELPDPEAPEARHREAVYRLGAATYADLLRLAAAERGTDAERLKALLAAIAALDVPVFPLKGADVVARGVPPGPEVGALLRAVEAWWIGQGMRPDREDCLAMLDRLVATRHLAHTG